MPPKSRTYPKVVLIDCQICGDVLKGKTNYQLHRSDHTKEPEDEATKRRKQYCCGLFFNKIEGLSHHYWRQGAERACSGPPPLPKSGPYSGQGFPVFKGEADPSSADSYDSSGGQSASPTFWVSSSSTVLRLRAKALRQPLLVTFSLTDVRRGLCVISSV